MNWVSAKEVIAFHDKILKQLPSVAGMPEPERAEALILQGTKLYSL